MYHRVCYGCFEVGRPRSETSSSPAPLGSASPGLQPSGARPTPPKTQNAQARLCDAILCEWCKQKAPPKRGQSKGSSPMKQGGSLTHFQAKSRQWEERCQHQPSLLCEAISPGHEREIRFDSSLAV